MIILFLTFDTEEEKEKFSEIYRDHAEFMMRIARRILHNSPDAEDVVQDAFLYVADHLEKINQFDRQKTRSYLAIITEHKAIDHLRSRHPEVSLDEQQLEHSLMADTKWEQGEDPYTEIDNAAYKQAINSARRMKVKGYALSDISYITGLSEEDIENL